MSSTKFQLGVRPMRAVEVEAMKPADFTLKNNGTEVEASSIRLVVVVDGALRRFKCTRTVFSSIYSNREERRPTFEMIKKKLILQVPLQPQTDEEADGAVAAVDIMPLHAFHPVVMPRDTDTKRNLVLQYNKSGMHITECPYYMSPLLMTVLIKKLRELAEIEIGDSVQLAPDTSIRLSSIIGNELTFFCPKIRATGSASVPDSYSDQQRAVDNVSQV